MYQMSYAENIQDNSVACRERERSAMEHAIELLENARRHGVTTPACLNALSYLCQLWTVLMEDLAAPDNDLPEALRADLLSVGIWILKEAEAIRKGTSENLTGLMEICTLIKDGLK